MKRVTICVPDELVVAAELEAHRRLISVSAVAREALLAHLGLAGHPATQSFAKLGRSGEQHAPQRGKDRLIREWRSG